MLQFLVLNTLSNVEFLFIWFTRQTICDNYPSGYPLFALIGVVFDRFVYIVQAKNGNLYTGVTTDLARRVRQHAEIKASEIFLRNLCAFMSQDNRLLKKRKPELKINGRNSTISYNLEPC